MKRCDIVSRCEKRKVEMKTNGDMEMALYALEEDYEVCASKVDEVVKCGGDGE